MVPGTAFEFDHRGKIRSRLSHVRRIVGISTYGSPRPYVAAINDNGRRILTRALRLTCGVTTRTTWIPFYAIDTATDAQRAEFLTSVEVRLERLT
jgi:putative NADPH-quinone reductase